MNNLIKLNQKETAAVFGGMICRFTKPVTIPDSENSGNPYKKSGSNRKPDFFELPHDLLFQECPEPLPPILL